ncbi:MAG: O-antigen ligase family protein [Candidatus Eremiobacteraeota bacterium]|nr:O-antigen ligase family protein [Candidatus Eremiobacteraeota bacterium]
MAFLAGLALVWGCCPRGRELALWFALGLTGWAAISTHGSLDAFLSRISLSGWIGFSAALSLFCIGLDGVASWRAMVRWMIFIATALCVWGLFRASGHLQATFTNPDCFSILPLGAAFLALGQAAEAQKSSRLGFLALATFLFLCVVLTGSRAALAGIGMGYLGMCLLLYNRLSRSLPAVLLVLSPLFLGILASMALFSGAGGRLARVERFLQGKDRVAVQSRVDVLVHGLRAVPEKPVLGFGPGAFHLAYQAYRPPMEYDEAYMNVAHDDWVQVLVELGLPGFMLWAGLWLMAIWNSWRCDDYPPGWCSGSLAALLAIAVYSSFNFLVPIPASLVWLAALLALAIGCPTSAQTSQLRASRWVVLPPALLLLALAIWDGYQGWGFLQQRRFTEQAHSALHTMDWDRAYDAFLLADRAAPGNARLLVDASKVCSRAYAFSGREVWLTRRDKCLEKAYAASPRDLIVLIEYARFLEYRGKPERARDLLAQGEKIAHYSPSLQRARARNAILLGRSTESVELLENIQVGRSSADNLAQAQIAYALARKDPEAGLKLIGSWDIAGRDARVAELVVELAIRRKNYMVASSVLGSLRGKYPDNPAYLLQSANLEGAKKNYANQLRILNQLRSRAFHDLEPGLSRNIWKIWANAKMTQKQSNDVAWELQGLLAREPQEVWARPILSQIYERKGLKSEARAVLREGLNYDLDGNLRLMLADLYMRHGHPEIAKGYYEELLRLPIGEGGAVEGRLKVANDKAKGTEQAIEKIDPESEL